MILAINVIGTSTLLICSTDIWPRKLINFYYSDLSTMLKFFLFRHEILCIRIIHRWRTLGCAKLVSRPRNWSVDFGGWYRCSQWCTRSAQWRRRCTRSAQWSHLTRENSDLFFKLEDSLVFSRNLNYYIDNHTQFIFRRL